MAAIGEYGAYPPETRNKSPTFHTAISAVNTLTHLCLGAITIGAVMLANSTSASTLYQHIYLCVIGYVVLMSEGIMTMSPYNGWASMLKHHERRTIHWVMQVCGSILVIAGSAIRISGVQNHFNSTHGILGIMALIFTCLTLINGAVNLFSSNIGIKPNAIKISHACFGSLTIICAFLCLIFGFNFAYSAANFAMLTAFTVFAMLGLLTPTCLRLFSRFK